MSLFLIALNALIVLTPQKPAQPSPAEKRTFEAAKAEAGTNVEKLVQLALWCEAHGMQSEKRTVLDLAVRLDPDNAAARGLLGQVSYRGRWESAEAVSARVKEDEALTAKLAEYNARRDRIDRDTEIERREVANFENARFSARAAELKMRLDRRIAPEHVRFALWCEANCSENPFREADF